MLLGIRRYRPYLDMPGNPERHAPTTRRSIRHIVRRHSTCSRSPTGHYDLHGQAMAILGSPLVVSERSKSHTDDSLTGVGPTFSIGSIAVVLAVAVILDQLILFISVRRIQQKLARLASDLGFGPPGSMVMPTPERPPYAPRRDTMLSDKSQAKSESGGSDQEMMQSFSPLSYSGPSP